MYNNLNFFAGPTPRLVGHRGAAGVAPENTLAAFERALADGAEIVELDVHATKDGEVVIIHDETVDRTSDGRGAVKAMSLAEIQKLDAGYRFTGESGDHPFRGKGVTVPTLEGLFTRIPAIKAIVEIKQAEPPIVKKVIETIRGAGKEKDVLLATERDDIMRDIRRAVGTDLACATGFCRGEVAAFVEWLARGAASGYRPLGSALQIPPAAEGVELVTREALAAAHVLGLEIFVWTINEAAEMERLLALGVDGIITDYPARLRALVGRR
jgi:glycerophosphoryl diester phosphodiesterase